MKATSQPRASSIARSCASCRGYLSKSSPGPNCVGLTKRLAIVRSAIDLERSISERCPSCRAPMVGTSPTVSPAAFQCETSALTASIVLAARMLRTPAERGARRGELRRQLGLEAFELRGVDAVGVTGFRIAARSDVGRVRLEGGADRAGQRRVLLDEAWQVAGRQPEQVVPDQDLAVASATGADPNRGDLEGLGDMRGNRGGDRLEHHGKAARALERARTVEDDPRAFSRSPLRAIAAQQRNRLWREA